MSILANVSPTTCGWVLGTYVVVILAVGYGASRRSARNAEEYYLAGRGLGTLVLFMALFGTNATSFVLVGVPGRAYHDGIGVFGVNAPIVALGIPLTFWAIGSPARRLGRELGALTPAELYGKRLRSRAVALLLFTVYFAYTLPYMVVAVRGAAVTLEQVTDGRISELAGGLGVLALAWTYTALGGMRATAWTNVLQGTIFLTFMIAAFFLIGSGVGGDAGIPGAMKKVQDRAPQLLTVGDQGLFEARAWTSWSLAISLTVIAFPHMLVRLMAADSERSLKNICRLYPLALVVLWVPAVMIGVWGAVEFPGLEGRASDRIFSLMVGEHLPPTLAALGFLAVLAAVMSTLDAQILTLGSMLSRDVLPQASDAAEAPSSQVRTGRLFGLLIALLTFALWRLAGTSIFDLASVSFSGYVTLTPTLLLALRWKRFNSTAALTSILLGNAVYFLALQDAGGLGAATRPAWFGFLPVAWGLLAASLAAVVVTRSVHGPRPQ